MIPSSQTENGCAVPKERNTFREMGCQEGANQASLIERTRSEKKIRCAPLQTCLPHRSYIAHLVCWYVFFQLILAKCLKSPAFICSTLQVIFTYTALGCCHQDLRQDFRMSPATLRISLNPITSILVSVLFTGQ